MKIIRANHRFNGHLLHLGTHAVFANVGAQVSARNKVTVASQGRSKFRFEYVSGPAHVFSHARLDVTDSRKLRPGYPRRDLTIPWSNTSLTFTYPAGTDLVSPTAAFVRWSAASEVFRVAKHWYVLTDHWYPNLIPSALWCSKSGQLRTAYYGCPESKTAVEELQRLYLDCEHGDDTVINQCQTIRVGDRLFFASHDYEKEYDDSIEYGFTRDQMRVARNGQELPELVCQFNRAILDFDVSRDGRWLAVIVATDRSDTDDCHLCELTDNGSVRSTAVFPIDSEDMSPQCRFSPDGLTLLITAAQQRIFRGHVKSFTQFTVLDVG
jgi:hypothetical protein